MGSGKGDSEQTTVSRPSPEREAAINKFLEMATTQADIPLSFFPGSTVAGRDSASVDASRLVDELGTSQYRLDAEDFLGDVLSGEFMGGPGDNELLDQRFDAMARRIEERQKQIVQPGLQTRFGGAGRSTSDAADKAFMQNAAVVTRELGDLGVSTYIDDHNRRMADRMAALGITPAIQGLEYGDIGQMRQQGAIEEDYMQRLLNEDINRFNFAQTEPEQRIDRFGNRVQKNLGFGTNVGMVQQGGDGGAAAGASILGIIASLLAA